MPGNAGFYSSDKENSPPGVKYKSQQKFEPKILVWLALSSKGISAPYTGTTKAPAVDVDPDLASSHYANKTTDWLNEQKVPSVPKYANPPNVPKARPIEDCWGILAQQMYSRGWTAINQEQLINRIKTQLKKN
ncbi:unnamed protein product [Didymodactylos carnosus]|uniref:Uncharacterized protein n=1 Tax=Didymodactylos carnosus TaxID=1234261 RepID=A0A814L8R6_9BILA|nr:unnamed protein product [Didymodactylos carnosus]CAF1060972.1 unnamed protein product [Didymodactylos carnosus]CAF3511249.1 unnamed protein product [Didymodactylos carnosus]CAF3829281.1 unnamed protein product [Didymodactylos carnosus]